MKRVDFFDPFFCAFILNEKVNIYLGKLSVKARWVNDCSENRIMPNIVVIPNTTTCPDFSGYNLVQ